MWINMYGHIHSSTFPNTPASFHPKVTTPTNPQGHINIYITTSTHPQAHAFTFRRHNSGIALGTLTSTTGGAFVISKIGLFYGRIHLHNIHLRRHFGFLNVMIILWLYSPPEAFCLSSTLWLLYGCSASGGALVTSILRWTNLMSFGRLHSVNVCLHVPPHFI